jgi:hypothetical protein
MFPQVAGRLSSSTAPILIAFDLVDTRQPYGHRVALSRL